MQCIPRNKILQHHPDTLLVIRKEYDLDKPGRIEDAVRILREWIQKQPHFKKKDFNDAYLEIVIYACKGSLERAKKQIDRMCTVRTLLPHFFVVRNPKTEFRHLFEVFNPVVLPKLMPNHYRVFMLKINEKVRFIKDYLDYFTYEVMTGDYVKLHDFSLGYICICDFTEANIMDILTNINPVHLRQLFTIFIEGYGMRIKGIYLYTASKLIDSLVSLMKQVANPKTGDRIHAFRTLENLTDIIPVDMLPEDYGGKEKSMKILCDELVDAISSEENLNYLKDLNQAGTDENLRLDNTFNEEYVGMAGTFRVLSVD